MTKNVTVHALIITYDNLITTKVTYRMPCDHQTQRKDRITPDY